MTCLLLQGQSPTRVRVWIDELPGCGALPDGLASEHHVIGNAAGIARRRLVAFEVFRAFGGMFHYGLLGGVFESSTSNNFKYKVAVEDPYPSIELADSLARALDRVLVGGGDEFALSITAGIEELDPRTLPAGVLTFTCMAHGEVGSAPVVFSALARAVIRTMTRVEDGISFEDAMQLMAD